MKENRVQSTVICNRLGLHARACSKLVTLVNKFKCDVFITKDKINRTVNAKSLMAVMMLAANMGTSVTIKVEGEDVVELDRALAEVIELIVNKFGEAE